MIILSNQDYFESIYQQLFWSPKDVEFVIYNKEIWRKAQFLLENSKMVIDLGAGGGTLLYNIAKETKADLLAIDLSRNALYQIKKIIPRTDVIQGDATATALSEEACDFIASSMFIEHVDDIAFLKEVYRILKPGGYFLV